MTSITNLPAVWKNSLARMFDCGVIAAALIAAVVLTTSSTQAFYTLSFWITVAVVTLATVVTFEFAGVYKGILRYSGQILFSRVTGSVALITFLFFLASRFDVTRLAAINIDTIVVFAAASILMVLGSRMLIVRLLTDLAGHKSEGEAVAIYGAGAAGRQLHGLLERSSEYRPVLYLDDNTELHNREIQGVKIVDPKSEKTLQKMSLLGVTEIFLAMPTISHAGMQKVFNSVQKFNCGIRTVPNISDIATGKASLDQIEEVKLSDLLGRVSVPPDQRLLSKCITDKVVLVTGAGGSIGSELCRQVLALKPTTLICFERSEFSLYNIDAELRQLASESGFSTAILPLLGSVTNKRRLDEIFSTFKIDTVYHAAAYKHVPIVEYNPVEGLWNNTFGTWYTAEVCRKYEVSNLILVSTDKAVRPTNVMGASKRLAEMVLQAYNDLTDKTTFSMVRFGNVLGSSGSVVPKFNEQIRSGGPITVTHPEVTRFFMTIPEAVALVIQAGAMAKGGDVFLLDMGESVKIVDLARQMIRINGLREKTNENPEGDIQIEFTGLRAGEKLYEELLINDNPIGTAHPKVMCAQEEMVAWPVLEKNLNEILEAMESFDLVKVKQLILDYSHGYAPSGEIEDLVWNEIIEAGKKNNISGSIH